MFKKTFKRLVKGLKVFLNMSGQLGNV